MTTSIRVAVLRNAQAPWAQTIVNALSAWCDIATIDRPPFHGRSIAGHKADPPLTVLSGGLNQDLRNLKQALAEYRPDVLLTLYGGSYAALGWASRFRPHVAYVVGSDIFGVQGLRRMVARRVLRSAQTVIANGEALASETRSAVGVATVLSIAHGIPLQRFPLRYAEHKQARILITRGYAPVYNQELVLDALALLGEDNDLSVTFAAGDGHKHLQHTALTMMPKGASWIQFLGGVPYDSMPSIMAAHTHYLSMSRHDGTSSSLLEAMASGLVPIVSNTAANREWIGDGGGHGILVPLGDPRALAAAVRAAASRPPARHELEANRALVEARGDIDTNVRTLFEALRDAAQSKAGS